MAATTLNPPKKRWKSVALPAEHGGWGFLIEPLLLGVLVAPTIAAWCLVLGAFGMFLARQPLKIVMVDWRKGKRFERTELAERFVIYYGITAVIGLALAGLRADAQIFIPLLMAIPLALIQLFADARGESRGLVPELGGATALAAFGTSIVLADGWAWEPAFAVWGILMARTIPAILYVRARLRLEKDQNPALYPAILAHVIGLGVVVTLLLADYAPALSVVAAIILLGRAIYGLSDYRKRVPTKVIGFQELGLGLMVVIAYAIDMPSPF